MFIQVITNSNGSGDWMVVQADDQIVYNGRSSLRPDDLLNLLKSVSDLNGDISVAMRNISDDEMEEIS